jgi:hypothetical protein
VRRRLIEHEIAFLPEQGLVVGDHLAERRRRAGGVASKVPGTQAVYILVDKNPNQLAAGFTIPAGTEANVSTRIKMGQSSDGQHQNLVFRFLGVRGWSAARKRYCLPIGRGLSGWTNWHLWSKRLSLRKLSSLI